MKYLASLLVLMSSSLIAQISPPYPNGGGSSGCMTGTSTVVQKGNGSGGCSPAVDGTDYTNPTTPVTGRTVLANTGATAAAPAFTTDPIVLTITANSMTANTFTGNLLGLANTATLASNSLNIANGALGSIPYQSAASTTLFVAGQAVAGTYLLCEQPAGSLIAPILCNFATLMASPGPIGSTTRSTVQATTVNATSTNVGSNIMAGEGVVTFSATPAFTSGATQSQIMTLTANVTSFTMAAGVAGRGFTLTLCQNATGGFTAVGAPANLRGFGTIGTTPSTCSSQHFVYSGNQTAWLADSAMVINM